ncbi:hypothetical protein N7509_006310 [Penicillium cosmopolitanum]|uniref:ATP-dependent DNA ligase family profile domain-containing protein n=1 Tax=Penicillium cosmopolitanum TaxID=1131564 RepID=A0A9W9W436_9EURO|nr:uncharacterized protein N7509_006310 [Penicillium cosmopolitanum]KAJ5398197.1 hypothetical protein N7509_006310 [Penicillium cosmopolitanum]
MGFKFTFLCDLLSDLEDGRIAKAASGTDLSDFRTVRRWFASYDHHINDDGTDRLALLSCMFPEKRTDRVFWLRETSLSGVIGRCLALGTSRLAELGQWRKPGGPDLGRCVEIVMRQTENYIPPGREVTTEEIDMALGMIASRCRFSGPEVRRQQTAVDVESTLSPLYRRLSSRDAKWLTRMILKSYAPVIIPPKHALERFHFLLPHLLQFQTTFEGALEMLDQQPMKDFPPHPNPKLAASLCATALEYLQPRTGIKIGRPEYFKARGIKHCLSMANRRRMSVERKYDGEYCQIHVDLTDKRTPFRIFSKSGKESTEDRSGIFPSLAESLRIGSEECRFSRRCILEGELVIWNDKRGEIAEFHKLRRFLSRSGIMIGIDNDSPPQPYEHLMIVFFDILVLDDDICLRKPHRQRRLLLKDVVNPIEGRADLAHQEILDFAHLDGRERLEVNMLKAHTQRWEGYVLKASDEPYFPIYAAGTNATFGRWIKLKKDYIEGLGDTLDVALVGAYYEARDAAALPSLKRLKWTHFLVGCLLNKENVLELGETPHFRIIDALHRHSMHKNNLQSLNQHGEFSACDPEECHTFTIEYGCRESSKACVLFKKPFVVELVGSGFDKPSGARYYALRHPRIRKIHTDRTFEDTASFQELQILADDARSVPTEELSDEIGHWRKRLKVSNGLKEYIVPRSRSLSSTCSSGSESEGDSKSKTSTTTSHDSEEEQIPELKSPQSQIQNLEKPARTQRGGDPSGAPVIYLDDTDSSSSSRSPHCNENILIENENLSSRQHTSQTKHGNAHEAGDDENSLAYYESQAKTEIPVSSLQGVWHISPASEQNTQSERSFQAHKNAESVFTHNSLQSPLTTIPVYMSWPSDMHTANTSCHSGLHEFIQTLNSPDSIASLEKSNPGAVRQGIAFGIVLVNPGDHPLGKEIHQAANTISDIFRRKRSCLSTRCKIFFLDSAILQQNIQPEDLTFCIRETWSELSRQYYYACLRWGLDEDSKDDTLVDTITSSMIKNHFDNSNSHTLLTLSVTFDESEILALGETTTLTTNSNLIE